jgi:hypothetical protein
MKELIPISGPVNERILFLLEEQMSEHHKTRGPLKLTEGSGPAGMGGRDSDDPVGD